MKKLIVAFIMTFLLLVSTAFALDVKTAAPTVNDDIDKGYVVGSMWLNSTSRTLYTCSDNTDGAAVWLVNITGNSATTTEVGAVTNGKACIANGTSVECATDTDGSGDCESGLCAAGHTHSEYQEALPNVYTVCASGCDYTTLNLLYTAKSGDTIRAVISDAQTLTATIASIPSTWEVQFINSGSITFGAYDITSWVGKIIGDPRHKIFNKNSTGVVVFSLYAPVQYRPEWWGAVADGSTSGATNSTAFTNMIAAISAAAGVQPVVNLSSGTYLIAGNPAINFNKMMLVNGNGVKFDYQTGTGIAIQMGGTAGATVSEIVLKDMYITRTNGGTGTASTDLVGTGLYVYNAQNFRLDNIAVLNFGYGMKFYGDQAGCAYGEVFNPILVTNLIAQHFDASANASSYCTDIKTYGGRLTFDATTYDTLAKASGSRLVKVSNTNAANHDVNSLSWFGTVIENATERKVEILSGDYNSFNNVYWEQGSFVGNYPYRASLTSCSTTATSAVITKSTHGLSIIAGDRILITGSTKAVDKGWYTVVSSDADTITVDHALAGTYSDIALTAYRTNIYFDSNSSSNILNGGATLNYNVVNDAGTNNILIDPQQGMSIGTAFPPSSTSDFSTDRTGGLTIYDNVSGTSKILNLGNLYDHDTTGDAQISFRGVDTLGTPRTYAYLFGTKSSRDTSTITGKIDFRAGATDSAGGLNFGFRLNELSIMEFFQPSRGTLKMWTYQNDSLADDGYVALPDTTDGMLFLACLCTGVGCSGGSGVHRGGMWLITDDGTTVLVVGTTDTEGGTSSPTDNRLSVYDNGSYARIMNRLGGVGQCRAIYWYN